MFSFLGTVVVGFLAVQNIIYVGSLEAEIYMCKGSVVKYD